MKHRLANNKALTKARPASGKIVSTVSKQLVKTSPKALLKDVRDLILTARTRVGLILCAGKRQEHVELLQRERDAIHVASYVTKLIPKKQLEQKLHEAVRLARARLENGRHQ